MTILASGLIFGGLLLTALCVPLWLRKIPPNGWYGVRIPASFRSDEAWYELNAYGGRLLTLGGVILAALGAAGFWLHEEQLEAYAYAVLAATMVVTLVPTILVVLRGRRY